MLDTSYGGIPESVVNLLHSAIGSVEQLESLLLLRNHRTSTFNEVQLAEKLYSSESAAKATLAALVQSGFLKSEENGYYRYAAPPELDQLVEELERLYKSRRVTIISTIYNRPDGENTVGRR